MWIMLRLLFCSCCGLSCVVRFDDLCFFIFCVLMRWGYCWIFCCVVLRAFCDMWILLCCDVFCLVLSVLMTYCAFLLCSWCVSCFGWNVDIFKYFVVLCAVSFNYVDTVMCFVLCCLFCSWCVRSSLFKYVVVDNVTFFV